MRPMGPVVGRELEEEKGSLFTQGGRGGQVHLALLEGRRGKTVRAFLICTTLAGGQPYLPFHPTSQPTQQGMVKPQ